MSKKQLAEAQSFLLPKANFIKILLSKLTRSKEMESEGEIMLIMTMMVSKSLDNVCRHGGLYLFYVTIIFAVVYLVRFTLWEIIIKRRI